MALLQALIALISRSLGTIFNAVFGWAVVGLFGRTSPREQTLLSGLVGAAAAWPVLLVGIAFPKIATWVLTFVPVSEDFPSWIIRILWLALAVTIPLIVGTVIAAKAPRGISRERFLTRLLRGFPITVSIAAAFLLMLITVPVLRVASAVRGRKDEHVPCITEGNGYRIVSARIDQLLRENRFQAVRTRPSWWLSAPSRILQKLGGKAVRHLMPENFAYWKGPELEVAFYPSDILIRGENQTTAWTHGLLAEALVNSPGLQTFSSETQELERQIRKIWSVYNENPIAHANSDALLGRLKEITRELGSLKTHYDEWQVVYRQTLQLGRALRGEPQLLESQRVSREAVMKRNTAKQPEVVAIRPLAFASTSELVAQLIWESGELARKEVELAKSELRADLRREIAMVKGVGVGGVCALCTLNMLLVAAALGLAEVVPSWAAALIVAAVVLSVGTVAALIGWSKRVRKPLEKTQKTLKENVQWAKERLA